MADYLCISVTLLDGRFHGRGEDSHPEWPPSPLRLYQALVAGAAGRWNERQRITTAVPALQWLESQPPPTIVSGEATESQAPYRMYVPDNVADKPAAAWSRGRDASIADYRSEKDVRALRLSDPMVNYVYRLESGCPCFALLDGCALGLSHLGWGTDQATALIRIITEAEFEQIEGKRWEPASSATTMLRVPKQGTFTDLANQHAAFLDRLKDKQFRPVPSLKDFEVVHYRRTGDPALPLSALFELRNANNDFCRYSLAKLTHIAGMVRHLAIKSMKRDPPKDRDIEDPEAWVDRYVAGHARDYPGEHRQFSYVPLPSIGHRHTDPSIRRVMIIAPPGDDAWLEHVAQRLAGLQLVPERGNEFGTAGPPSLIRIRRDKVTDYYTKASNQWASVTPVILPGYDDRKRAKREKLIRKALREVGIEQECTFEWSPISQFSKVLTAHPKDREGRPIFIKPPYLQNYTSVHLTLSFTAGIKMPGPLAIGAGRHCGFGLLANRPRDTSS